MNIRFIRMTGLGLALMLGAAACSGSTSEPAPTAPPSTSATQVTAATTTSTTMATTEPAATEPVATDPVATGPTELTIGAEDNEGFSTNYLTAPAGEISVTFKNTDAGSGEPHNWRVTVDDAIFMTNSTVGPDTQTVTFTIGTPGEYDFFCDAHLEVMNGVLTVTP